MSQRHHMALPWHTSLRGAEVLAQFVPHSICCLSASVAPPPVSLWLTAGARLDIVFCCHVHVKQDIKILKHCSFSKWQVARWHREGHRGKEIGGTPLPWPTSFHACQTNGLSSEQTHCQSWFNNYCKASIKHFIFVGDSEFFWVSLVPQM